MRRLLLCLLASGLPIACSSAPPDNGNKAPFSPNAGQPPSNTMPTFIASTTSFTAASSLLSKMAKPLSSWAFKA